MSPDDPRHGTNAGYQAHLAAGEKACAECLDGRGKEAKRRRLARVRGAEPYYELGHRLWRMTVIYGAPDLVAVGAVHDRAAVYDLRARGPQALVRRATLERLMSADTSHLYTSIGLSRRLQALAVMGWTLTEVVEKTGLARSGLQRYRNGAMKYSWPGVPERIVQVYNELHMNPKASPTRWERAAISDAKSRGWAPPLAWNNIDDPDERPRGMRDHIRRDLLTEWAELEALGESIDQAASRLGVTVGAIERAMFRARKKAVA